MITISRLYTFEAAHFLPHVPLGHKCKNIHGHSYQLTVEIAGEIEREGWIRDFADIDAFVCPIVATLDHHLLNDILENPTSENLVRWFAEKLGPVLHLHSLELSETTRSRARWTPA